MIGSIRYNNGDTLSNLSEWLIGSSPQAFESIFLDIATPFRLHGINPLLKLRYIVGEFWAYPRNGIVKKHEAEPKIKTVKAKLGCDIPDVFFDLVEMFLHRPCLIQYEYDINRHTVLG